MVNYLCGMIHGLLAYDSLSFCRALSLSLSLSEARICDCLEQSLGSVAPGYSASVACGSPYLTVRQPRPNRWVIHPLPSRGANALGCRGNERVQTII